MTLYIASVLETMHVKDVGGSVVTHAFGAFFGISVSVGLGVKAKMLVPEYRESGYIRFPQ